MPPCHFLASRLGGVRLAWFALVCVACGTDGPPPQGTFTESVCPTADPPTYASFGQTFFVSYCTTCHSQDNAGDSRQGAPVTIDFDTEPLIRENTSRIDKQAAFGPAGMNTLMPPPDLGYPVPSDAERRQLGQFIACELAP